MNEQTIPSSIDPAMQRTHLATERTFFAALRTGLAIAAGGLVIVKVLGDNWPDLLSFLLAGVFIFVGYGMMLAGLGRYKAVASRFDPDQDLEVISPRLMSVFTITLQVALMVVLGLFLLNLVVGPG